MNYRILLQYWREGIIAILVIAGGITYAAWKHSQNSLALAENNIRNAQVDFETFRSGVVQAQNELVKSQKELKEQMSAEFKKEIEDQKIKILAAVKTQIAVQFEEVYNKPGEPGEDNVYHYSDTLLSHAQVDVNDPNKPLWSYKVTPFSIDLEASLGFDEKEGKAKFWAYPVAKNLPAGVKVTIPQLVFSNSEEYNQWITKLRGKDVYVPVMPKYTFGAMVGVEWAKEFPGGVRTVYGLDVTRNWSNGAGLGVGVLGSTVFARGTFSFGK